MTWTGDELEKMVREKIQMKTAGGQHAPDGTHTLIDATLGLNSVHSCLYSAAPIYLNRKRCRERAGIDCPATVRCQGGRGDHTRYVPGMEASYEMLSRMCTM